jgi:hypothetical protein
MKMFDLRQLFQDVGSHHLSVILFHKGLIASPSCLPAQIYDQNVDEGFPVLRVLLDAARRWRAAGTMPADWAAGARDRCEKWRAPTHSAAWRLIEDFEGQFEDDDWNSTHPAAWSQIEDFDGQFEPEDHEVARSCRLGR